MQLISDPLFRVNFFMGLQERATNIKWIYKYIYIYIYISTAISYIYIKYIYIVHIDT